jgi:hypothetical protein
MKEESEIPEIPIGPNVYLDKLYPDSTKEEAYKKFCKDMFEIIIVFMVKTLNIFDENGYIKYSNVVYSIESTKSSIQESFQYSKDISMLKSKNSQNLTPSTLKSKNSQNLTPSELKSKNSQNLTPSELKSKNSQNLTPSTLKSKNSQNLTPPTLKKTQK